MTDRTDIVPVAPQGTSTETFAWRDLRFHVVTPEPMTPDQIRTIRQAVPKTPSVGRFADLLGYVLGRHVRIHTERPSADVTFEVAR